MPVPSIKHFLFIILAILLILTLLLPAWEQRVGIALVWIFLLFCLISTSYMIVWKHTKKYQQTEISRVLLIRNICIEIAYVLLAMVVAGVVGWYSSRLVTSDISNDTTKLIMGIGTGLLVGWAVGMFMNEVSSRVVKTLPSR